MKNGLGNVGTKSDAKENDKEICGWKIWTKGPLGCLFIFENSTSRQSVVMISGGDDHKSRTFASRHGRL